MTGVIGGIIQDCPRVLLTVRRPPSIYAKVFHKNPYPGSLYVYILEFIIVLNL
jgi:hypothetical protein